MSSQLRVYVGWRGGGLNRPRSGTGSKPRKSGFMRAPKWHPERTRIPVPNSGDQALSHVGTCRSHHPGVSRGARPSDVRDGPDPAEHPELRRDARQQLDAGVGDRHDPPGVGPRGKLADRQQRHDLEVHQADRDLHRRRQLPALLGLAQRRCQPQRGLRTRHLTRPPTRHRPPA